MSSQSWNEIVDLFRQFIEPIMSSSSHLHATFMTSLQPSLLSVDSSEFSTDYLRIALPPKFMKTIFVGIGSCVILKPSIASQSPSSSNTEREASSSGNFKSTSNDIFVGIAWPSAKLGFDKIGLSTLVRNQLNLKIGDAVEVSKLNHKIATVLEADRLDVLFIDASSHSYKSPSPSDEIQVLFLKQHLIGQYVHQNMITAISIYGRLRRYRITFVQSKQRLSNDTVNEIGNTGKEDNMQCSIFKVTSRTQFSLVEERHSSQAGHDNNEESGKQSNQSLDYTNIGGLQEQITELRDLVELPLKNPEIFLEYGIKPPRGVLLYGPPGTGKTLLAKILASVTGTSCHTISAPEIMSKYYGESESKLRELFETAHASSPSIIFIDEIDAIAPKRESSESEASMRIVGTLLTLMDGITFSSSPASSQLSSPSSNTKRGKGNVIILAATNRPNALDPALRRPGRFDREIEIPIPNEAGRLQILNVYLKNMKHSLSIEEISQIAAATHGYVGADLSNLCKEASLISFKRFLHSKNNINISSSNTSNNNCADPSEETTLLGAKHEDFAKAMAEIRPSAMREIMVDIPKVAWSDIGGYEEVKEKLKQAVEWPLKHPEVFSRLNIQPTRGILLYGPPGCSKTLLAKAVATQAGLNFIPIKGPELFSKYVGDSEKAVRDVFRKARAAAPSIIFFDEIDAIGAERGHSGETSSVHDRVLAQMLNELDGIEPLKQVLFLAATNRPDIIDKALMRPGRIDQAIYINPPDEAARRQILEICLKKIPHPEDLDLAELVQLTEGFSGAEVTYICREAGLIALQENMEAQVVARNHFLAAIQNVVPTITPTMIEFYTTFMKRSLGQ